MNRLRLLVVGICLSVWLVVPLGMGRWLEDHVFHVPGLGFYMSITFLALPAMTDTTVLGGVLRGRFNPTPHVMSTYYILPLTRAVILVPMLWLGFGLMSVIVSTTVSYIATATLLALYYAFVQDRGAPPPAADDRQSWGSSLSLVKIGIWMAFSIFFYNSIRNIDVLTLGASRPIREVGEYGSLSTISQFVQFFPNALALTLGPTVAKCYAEGDFAGMKHAFGGYLRLASLLGAPIFAAAAAWGPVMDVVFGKSFHFSFEVSLALALGYLVSGVLGPMGFGLSMTGRHRWETGILIAGNLVVTGLCLLLARPFGQVGVATAVCLGFVAINAGRFGGMAASVRIVPGSRRDFIPPVVCLALALTCEQIGFRFLPRSLPTLIGSGLVYGLLMLGAYWLFLLTQEEKDDVKSATLSMSRRVRPSRRAPA